jgi:hypothetical protein
MIARNLRASDFALTMAFALFGATVAFKGGKNFDLFFFFCVFVFFVFKSLH